MKQGNQFYLDIQIVDDNCNILTNEMVRKIVFYISADLKKTYASGSDEVVYDSDSKCFRIWLSEEETLQFNGLVDLDARILFENNTIMGCYKSQEYFNPALVNESILEGGD